MHKQRPKNRTRSCLVSPHFLTGQAASNTACFFSQVESLGKLCRCIHFNRMCSRVHCMKHMNWKLNCVEYSRYHVTSLCIFIISNNNTCRWAFSWCGSCICITWEGMFPVYATLTPNEWEVHVSSCWHVKPITFHSMHLRYCWKEPHYKYLDWGTEAVLMWPWWRQWCWRHQ